MDRREANNLELMRNRLRCGAGPFLLALLLALDLWVLPAPAQYRSNRYPTLAGDYFKSGAISLRAFAPVARATRNSIVKFAVDGKAAVLGAIIDPNGLVLTKASEIKEGKLTCTLADGKVVVATLLAVDEENDVGLVKLAASGLKAIEWTAEAPFVGQWAITPGIEGTPEAVGIISVPSRKILPKRALIGVVLDFETPTAKIREILPGLGAEQAGLKPGDVIVAVNDAPVKKSEELTGTLRNFREGQTVRLRVQRDEQEFDAAVKMTVPKPERAWWGFDRQERMNRLGTDLSQRAEGFALAVQHDTVLQPWQCGGPLVNLEGKAVGLNIARAGRVASYALPAALVQQIITDLKAQAPLTVKHEERRETRQ